MSGQELVSVSADAIVARLDELRVVIAAVEVNGKPLGSSVRFEPAAKAGDPIEVIISPPSFVYASNSLGPSSMVVDVFVVAPVGDRSVRNLIALERGVADAIDLSEFGTVRGSQAGVWRRGSTDLPAYVITAEVDIPDE